MTYKFSKELYSKAAVFKAAYRFIDDFYIHIDLEKQKYVIEVIPKKEENEFSENEFINEMLIQQTREIVEMRTYKIRELMYARALATTVIDDKESVETIEDNSKAEEILIDWFDKYE